MALVVEDGTGKSNAESYVSVATFKAYAASRGYEVDAGDEDIEAAARIGTTFIDAPCYRSLVLVNNQALEFPRADLQDKSGRSYTGVPPKVCNALCEAMYLHLSGTPLMETLDRGGKIASESVAGISVSYQPDAPAGRVFQTIEAYLKPFYRDPNQPLRPLPAYADGDPAFSTGMFEMPGTACDGEV